MAETCAEETTAAGPAGAARWRFFTVTRKGDPETTSTEESAEGQEAVCPDSGHALGRVRLSGNPAHDASEWHLLRGVCGKEDGLPCCRGNRDAGTSGGNPDIRVPDKPEKEDGLPERGDTEDEEDAEETGREEDRERAEDEALNTSDDGSRIGNHAVPKKATEQWGIEESGDTRAGRHVPPGTWLTKVRSFLKDSILGKRKGYRGRGGERDGTGGARGEAWREKGGYEGE
ncbi:hypothetical protein NDU88_009015 [Pleurodeles waltl]|uniref:Uncharacterized protein n=1 Tax=Pleurodeles waltl TaxID=8319 RepID=A0AAV7RU26_PLEWA|nr:hypothetical protein NDU88_009015 [Pleurodeles waltl]